MMHAHHIKGKVRFEPGTGSLICITVSGCIMPSSAAFPWSRWDSYVICNQ